MLEAWPIIAPALLAGLVVLLTHVPLGMQVLKRGIVFIDLAIAQIAALGVIVASLFGWPAQGMAVQLTAGAAALLGAWLLAWMERRWPEVQEAQIGVLFVLAATGGILLLAHNPQGDEHLRDLLAGQILWVGYSQLIVPSVISLAIAALLVWTKNQLAPLAFYGLFAVAVTLSVQLVGVYLVFASLILPALASRKFSGQWRLAVAALLGVLAYTSGLLISTWADLPSGAVIVWCLAVLAALVYRLGPA